MFGYLDFWNVNKLDKDGEDQIVSLQNFYLDQARNTSCRRISQSQNFILIGAQGLEFQITFPPFLHFNRLTGTFQTWEQNN